MYFFRSLPGALSKDELGFDLRDQILVHIWNLDEFVFSESDCIKVLSEFDMERLSKISHQHRRSTFLQARFIFKKWVELLLGRQIHMLPDLEVGPHGKLAWPKNDDTPMPWNFNWSHSGTWLAISFFKGGPIGIDIESKEEPGFSEKWSLDRVQKLSIRLLADQESQVIKIGASRSEAEDIQNIVRLLNQKESLVKALGQSLIVHGKTLDLDSAKRDHGCQVWQQSFDQFYLSVTTQLS